MKSKIVSISAEILDVPIKRPHHFSAVTIDHQNYVLIRIRTNDGIEGIGETVAPGGPWWGGESVETIKVIIDKYLAPELIGEDPTRIEFLLAKMNKIAAGNAFAKSGVEIALYDVVGKSLGIPVYQLLGGLYREAIPTRWALALGEVEKDVKEANEKLDAGLHTNFKLKAGAINPDQDSRRVVEVAKKLEGKATVAVDPNGSWDRITTEKWLPVFEEAGIDILEQPLPKWDIEGLAKLTASSSIPVMADESICSIQDALKLVHHHAVNIFALKTHKSGGLTNVRKIAAVADGAGIACFGGTLMESSIGTAACMHVFCSIPNLTQGCELFGPLWLKDDLVEEPIRYEDGKILLPHGPGLGVTLDEDKISKYKRKE